MDRARLGERVGERPRETLRLRERAKDGDRDCMLAKINARALISRWLLWFQVAMNVEGEVVWECFEREVELPCRALRKGGYTLARDVRVVRPQAVHLGTHVCQGSSSNNPYCRRISHICIANEARYKVMSSTTMLTSAQPCSPAFQVHVLQTIGNTQATIKITALLNDNGTNEDRLPS